MVCGIARMKHYSYRVLLAVPRCEVIGRARRCGGLRKCRSCSRRRLAASQMASRLDTVARRIGQERGVVMRVIIGPKARGAFAVPAMRQAGPMEGVYGPPAGGLETPMATGVAGPGW